MQKKNKGKNASKKKGHRTITRYTHEKTYKTEKIISTKEGKEEYKPRSQTVEAHNGTFKKCLPL